MRTLDAVALAKLRNLRFGLPRHRAESHLSGRHRSVLFGFSQEFAHHRQYTPGDELKFLDWKVYARKDRFFVKQFQEDVSMATYFVVDRSGSMGYQGTGPAPKWSQARVLAAALSYLVLSQGDAAGLITFDTAPGDFIPPRRQLSHLELIDSALDGRGPGGETDLAGVLRGVAGLIKRRSLIVLISDLLGDPASILQTVKALRARKHEVFVLQVLDPAERDLPMDGPILFESLEDRSTLRCEASLLREAYRAEFSRQLRTYESGFRRSGIAYAALYTEAPWDVNLARFLSLQRAAS